jgi:hypothetical protein
VLVVLGAVLVVIVTSVGVFVLTEDDGEDAASACTPTVEPGPSIARRWNEALLAAIREDFPAPTVHARNLFHTSAAMWDAWSVYDPVATGVFFDEKHAAEDTEAARDEAISYAAYRILVERFLPSPGAEVSVTRLDDLMAALCYDLDVTETEGDRPAAIGNRIAATILDATIDDGSNEADDYTDPDYQSVNPPLVVAEPGTTMADPNRWQPLELEAMVAQNGVPLTDTVQAFVGSHWGAVEGFALDQAEDRALDPGPPPLLGDPETDTQFKRDAVEVIRYSATLDPAADASIDLSPVTQGDREVGNYEAAGRPVNPVTGDPYEPATVPLGDYGRVVAEFWADGPNSETPPGHWNTIANDVSDQLGSELRIGGEGPVVDRLQWDTSMYLALNGAVHDAAIAAWDAKGRYDYARPISMIRYLSGLGQSSDPAGPAYDPSGLPLEPGLVEVITAESSAPGERHVDLADHVGEIAIRSWAGEPEDPETEAGGVEWIRAVEWVPYQRATFVTPAFAAYVSGHSTFSRAAAEVLTELTGSEYFPDGLGTFTAQAGSLEFESGPSVDVELQWATYADAADEAGVSRLYGGIHVRSDDLRGREMGVAAGRNAWALASQYLDGSIAD